MALNLMAFNQVKCHQATASDLPFYDIFAPQKVPFSKISDDVILCDLWFGPPQSKILATPMFQQCKNHSQMAMVFFNGTMHHAILQKNAKIFLKNFEKNANIFLKIEINFARLAWQLPIPKPHRKLVCYHKKVSLDM